jgi:two-component system LytT family response regulator
MGYKTVIVEDEAHAVNLLKAFLVPHKNDIEIIGEAINGPDAVALIDTVQPDLVFLDMNLPGFDGFEILERIHCFPLVIMITADKGLALKAFNTNAIGFIVKPFDPDDLQKVIQKLKRVSPLTDQLISEVQLLLKGSKDYPRGITCKVGNTKMIIPNEEIFYFQAELKYTTVVTRSGRYCFEIPLKELEERLDPDCFMRIHRSSIVNLKQVKGIKSNENGKMELTLRESQSVLQVSESYREKLRSLWI